MKIALIGYGKMGKMVEAYAVEQGHEIVARLTSQQRHFPQIEAADVCIDFTQPTAVLETLDQVAFYGKPLVIGTTGWEVEKAHSYVDKIGILYAPNFSLGVALFERLLKKAYALFSPTYDMCGLEIHHRMKKDAPSGTAKRLSNQMPGLEFESIRSGMHPGTHQVIFDSPEDTIELTHRARSREGFARGAIDAALWLSGKVGFYTLDDYIEEKLGCKEPLPH